jgi:hypothetical protein
MKYRKAPFASICFFRSDEFDGMAKLPFRNQTFDSIVIVVSENNQIEVEVHSPNPKFMRF